MCKHLHVFELLPIVYCFVPTNSQHKYTNTYIHWSHYQLSIDSYLQVFKTNRTIPTSTRVVTHCLSIRTYEFKYKCLLIRTYKSSKQIGRYLHLLESLHIVYWFVPMSLNTNIQTPASTRALSIDSHLRVFKTIRTIPTSTRVVTHCLLIRTYESS